MNIVVYGAGGKIGSRIVDEALRRGHAVTGVGPRPEKIAPRPHVTAVAGDATDASSIAATAAGAHLAISAYSPGSGPQDDLSKNAAALLEGLASAGVPRVIVVGGAGSLEVEPGRLWVDDPAFTEAAKPRARAQKGQLDVFRASAGSPVTWTFVSPSASIKPGERTGRFRLGGDRLLRDAAGVSAISMEDYAIAILDEAENAAHPNQRITVGY
jgi:putative NADH-flavin reductase